MDGLGSPRQKMAWKERQGSVSCSTVYCGFLTLGSKDGSLNNTTGAVLVQKLINIETLTCPPQKCHCSLFYACSETFLLLKDILYGLQLCPVQTHHEQTCPGQCLDVTPKNLSWGPSFLSHYCRGPFWGSGSGLSYTRSCFAKRASLTSCYLNKPGGSWGFMEELEKGWWRSPSFLCLPGR